MTQAIKAMFLSFFTIFRAVNEVASALEVLAGEGHLAAKALAAENAAQREADLKSLKAQLKSA
jgi:hypothetical protein